MDIIDEINMVHRMTDRQPHAGGEGRTVVVRRGYDAPIEDVWDALTDPKRLSRWFAPVTGDFRLGGRYQVEGNAGGEILRCEPPRLVAVSWIHGGPDAASEVEVRLSPDGDGGTLFELEHVAIVPDDFWDQYGPGAVGVGWDLALLGLAMHLRGEHIDDKDAWGLSPEARRFVTASSQAWGDAHKVSGADPAAADTAMRNTTAFYSPPIA